MPKHKSSDYKLTVVQYYLVEDKTQEEVCKIFMLTKDQINMYPRKITHKNQEELFMNSHLKSAF